MKENRDITWIIDCIILAVFFLCLCSLASCEDAYAETDTLLTTRTENAPTDTLTSAQTDSLIAETWGVEVWRVKSINVLLNWSLQVEGIYIDLLRQNPTLLDRIESPSHQYCLECKVKALKFCFNHRLFDDTVGEMEEADWLYDLEDELNSSRPSEFALWWDRLE